MTKKTGLLDAIDNDDCHADLTYKNGFVFSPTLLFITFLLGCIGVAAILYGETGLYFGPILVIFSVYSMTYRHGTDISIDNQYIRPYSRFYGIKTGKWIPTTMYPDMAILKMGNSMGIQYEKTSADQRVSKGVYDLYLLSENHRRRVYITSFSTMEKAYENGQYLADLLDKKFTTFKPIISKATLSKRYERHY